MRSIGRRWWSQLGAFLAVAVALFLACCWSYRIWSWKQFQVYQAMAHECDPVWRDLHYGRVQAGDPVEEVITHTHPSRIKRSGQWVVLEYQKEGLVFTGVRVVARDGRLVGAYAWSCTWRRQFFDTMSEEERAEFFHTLFEQAARVKGATSGAIHRINHQPESSARVYRLANVPCDDTPTGE